MSQIGSSVEISPEGVRLSFSTPENGLEYQIIYDRQGFVEMLRSMLLVAATQPDIFLAVLGGAVMATETGTR